MLATMMAYYSILGSSYGAYYALFSEFYLTFWLRRGCALGHDGLKASALDVVHPKGKVKGKGKGIAAEVAVVSRRI